MQADTLATPLPSTVSGLKAEINRMISAARLISAKIGPLRIKVASAERTAARGKIPKLDPAPIREEVAKLGQEKRRLAARLHRCRRQLEDMSRVPPAVRTRSARRSQKTASAGQPIIGRAIPQQKTPDWPLIDEHLKRWSGVDLTLLAGELGIEEIALRTRAYRIGSMPRAI